MEATSVTSAKVILTFNENASNNFSVWMESLIDNFGPVYGNLAKVLKTHTKYIVPNVKEEDYMPRDELDDEGAVIAHGITYNYAAEGGPKDRCYPREK